MTAADLIALLRECPKACGALGIRTDVGYAVNSRWPLALLANSMGEAASVFNALVTGAATLKAIDLDIELPVKCLSNGKTHWAVNDGNETSHPTFLHATLAAIEAALKGAGHG